jgi:hypothetical protein
LKKLKTPKSPETPGPVRDLAPELDGVAEETEIPSAPVSAAPVETPAERQERMRAMREAREAAANKHLDFANPKRIPGGEFSKLPRYGVGFNPDGNLAGEGPARADDSQLFPGTGRGAVPERRQDTLNLFGGDE